MKTNSTFLNRTMHFMLILAVSIMAMPAFAQTKHVVAATNNVFTPAEIEVMAGDTVEWVNEEGYHNVNATQETYPDNPESFGNDLGRDWTFSHVFTVPGTYDYQCDAHVALGMVGKVVVTDSVESYTLSVEFSGMTPHIGQMLWLSVVDKDSWMEVGRVSTTAAENFTVDVNGIEKEKSYYVDFFADFNGNGVYDAPPEDHAWRMELDSVMGDTTLMFQHNTDFTDIMWKNKLTVHFMNMNPHIGQTMWLAVVDTANGMTVDRVQKTAEEDFMVDVYGIEPGKSYNVDFFVDFNENGMYDAPPADHAWRMELNSVMGDTTLTFTHNTNFTDIMWGSMITLHFTGMTPHVGQNLWLMAKNTDSGEVLARKKTRLSDADFMMYIFGVDSGNSYTIDFFADFNENGMYDAPPADHAWQIQLDSITGDTTVVFQHNTNFTDIMWMNELTVDFMGMNPHIGQMLTLYLVDEADGMMKDTVVVDEIMSPDFMVHSYKLESGHSYKVNFYVDFNENGMYDAPPTDHAWQLMLSAVTGDTTVMFQHNTNFTDIFEETSVAENRLNQLKLYPNPASDVVWIETGEINPREFTIYVYDIAGKTNRIDYKVLHNRIQFNVQNLKQGIYMVELRSLQEKHILKLIRK